MTSSLQDDTTAAARELPATITGAVLKAMRVAVGMSTRELAGAIGCSHQHLSRVESGKRSLTAGFGWPLAQAIADQLTHLNAEHYRAAER